MLDKIIFLVEEESMATVLGKLVPKITGEITLDIRLFRGKQDLIKQLPNRLKSYHQILDDRSVIIVLIDLDSEDCVALKQKMEDIAYQAGLMTKSSNPTNFQIANRIVIMELEAWFFGDWDAVKAAYPRVPERIPRTKKFRNPDAIKEKASKALERILQAAGYFKGGLRKIECAEKIATFIDPEKNRSPSFKSMISAIEAAKKRD